MCTETFDSYRYHYNLNDLRIWNKLPGETRDIELYYLVWQLRPACNMILVYDKNEQRNPFLVYVDWARFAYPHPFFESCGQFVLINQCPDFYTAIQYMLVEPSIFRAASHHKCSLRQYYDIPGENEDNTPIPWLRFLYSLGCSLLEMLREIEFYKKHGNERKGTRIYVVHDRCGNYDENGDFHGFEGDTVYETTL